MVARLSVACSVALLLGAEATAMDMTEGNFDSMVFDDATSAFLKFYAPWCEWSLSARDDAAGIALTRPLDSPPRGWQAATARPWRQRGNLSAPSSPPTLR